MSFHTGIETETAGPGPAGDEGSFWGLCLSEPVYNAEWVDASVVEFLQCVNAMPPNERLQRVQDFLEEGIIKLRDSVRFSCDIYQGFPTQGESALSNIGLVSEAIQRVSAWEQELQQRVYAQEMQMEDLLRRGIDNDQALDRSSQDADPQPMRSPSVSSDESNQPMDISSGSSDGEGGILIQQDEDTPKHQSTLGLVAQNGPPPSPSPAAPPASGGQAQARPNYAGSLKPHPSLPPRPPTKPHPSLPPRPPTSFGRGWGL